MAVLVAPHAGFCFGVRTAVEKGEELIREGLGPIATLGPLFLNPQDDERLASLGIISRDTYAEIKE